jgi:hypothetical protein
MIPPLAKVRQKFARPFLTDVPAAVRNEMARPGLVAEVRPGDKVAITVGSRGIANLPQIIREIVNCLRQAGAEPFIVPAMGSHGGATAMGQIEVLSDYHITHESVGAPILSSMEVVDLSDGGEAPVYFDKIAMAADHTLVVGRIKLHPAFRGSYESGLVKMIAIGLGKQRGAEYCHGFGVENMSAQIERMARIALNRANILCGVALLENAYDETCKVVAVPAAEILAAEPALLQEAKSNMPQIYFSQADVLVIDEMGKNISGTGMDPNVIERYTTPSIPNAKRFQRIVVRDLTPESHGNFNGAGLADICTRRVFDKMDFAATYPNQLTSRVVASARIPMVMENDRQAIQAAVKTCCGIDENKLRMIRIKNTKDIEEILISPALMTEAQNHPQVEVVSQPAELLFDSAGNLLNK